MTDELSLKEFGKLICDIEKGRKGVSRKKAEEIALAIGVPPVLLVRLALEGHKAAGAQIHGREQARGLGSPSIRGLRDPLRSSHGHLDRQYNAKNTLIARLKAECSLLNERGDKSGILNRLREC